MARERSAVSLWVKYILFSGNFLLWIVGLAVTALTSYILYTKQKKVSDVIDYVFDPSMLLCTAGAITLVVTALGWIGALREYTTCLRLYNWVVTVLFLGQLVLIIFIFIFYFVPSAKQTLGLFPEKTFKDAIRKYGTVEDDDMKNLIDNMQESTVRGSAVLCSLGCCGFSDSETGFLDWNENEYFNCTKKQSFTADSSVPHNPEACSVPPSCCKLQPGELKNVLCGHDVMVLSATNVVQEATDHKPIYTLGCLKAVGTYINDHALVIGGLMLAILIPQMYFMYLSRTLRDQVLIQRSKWNRSTPKT